MPVNFCTFGHALKDHFNITLNNTKFVNLLLEAIPVDGSKHVVSKSKANSLMSGRGQVPSEIRYFVSKISKDTIAAYFENNVIQFINEDDRPEVMNTVLDHAYDDSLITDTDKELLNKYNADNEFSKLLSLSFVYAIINNNSNPEMFIHIAPPLSPWEEMPDYSAYLNRIYDSTSKIRTLLYYEEPKPFYDFYVCNNIAPSPFFLFSQLGERSVSEFINERISDATINKLSSLSNCIILTGTGGLGKSMMMRNLLLHSVNSFKEDGMIPVFVPLKDYKTDDTDLLNYVYKKLTDDGKHYEVTIDQFRDTLKHNRVQLLLDGYDELKTNCVDIFENALKKFMRKYPNNFYILSSRPFDHIASFRCFLMMELVPFNKHQSLELINKLEFRPDEPSIKQKFAQQLDENLFDTHTEFASNPLLLTIMLMTFEQYAEVPSKMHIFYREAYATLSQKHDASKGAYKRALHTGLSADRFADYFAEFCARTYNDEKYEMNEYEIRDYFDKLNIRKKSSDAEFSVDDFIYDLRHNLCLLYRESGKYHFTHRSFQEYFCALYYSKQKDRALYQIGLSFEKRKNNSLGDKTFHMLYDMIPEKVEEYIFLPFLKELFDECSHVNGYWNYLSKYVQYILYGSRYSIRHFRSRNPKDRILIDCSSFILGFILYTVVKPKKGIQDITFPYYKEFITGEYQVFESDDGKVNFISSYLLSHAPELVKGSLIRKEYEYKFKLKAIAKNKENYPDLVEIFEREDFQTLIDYKALKSYYLKLKASIEDSENDSLDFLN